MCVCLSLFLYVGLSVCLYICLSICLSVCLFIWLFILVSIFIVFYSCFQYELIFVKDKTIDNKLVKGTLKVIQSFKCRKTATSRPSTPNKKVLGISKLHFIFNKNFERFSLVIKEITILNCVAYTQKNNLIFVRT